MRYVIVESCRIAFVITVLGLNYLMGCLTLTAKDTVISRLVLSLYTYDILLLSSGISIRSQAE